MIRNIVLGAAAAMLSASPLPAWAGPDAASLAGVYKHLQAPSTEPGGVPKRDEDILEIVPYGPTNDKIYFRLYMRFANYHVCDVTGIGKPTRTGLEYQTPVEGGLCRIKMTFTPKGLNIEDSEDRCRTTYCGARGSLNWTSPIRRSDRRPIRYLTRILESDMYEQAVENEKKAMNAGKPPATP